MTFAALSLHGARFAHGFELALQTRDTFLHATPIDFQLRFTRAARADPAGLARKVVPHAGEARQQILQLRQLDLQPAFAAAGALREDVEDELGAIENFPREEIFQIAPL